MFNRKVHWESIHDGKSPLDVSWYQKEPSSSLELIRNTQVSDGEPIIDVGGGTSLLVDFLIEVRTVNEAVHPREPLGPSPDQFRDLSASFRAVYKVAATTRPSRQCVSRAYCQ